MSAVVDTSSLIALGRLNLLRLLPLIFGEVYIPLAVADEWTEGSADPPEAIAAAEGLPTGWLQVRPLHRAADAIQANLGRGEAEVIALARQVGAEYAVLDDLAARAPARRRRVRVIGTVGVLLAARRRGAIPSVIPLLEELRGEGFHLSDDILETVRRDEGDMTAR